LGRLQHRLNEKYISKYIFIHINRTGGSSIEAVLKLSLKQHESALEKRDYLGQKRWNNIFKFAFVRNPWDKVVSHYHHRVNTNQTRMRDNPIEFGEWVRLTYKDRDPRYYDWPLMFYPQMKWISDSDGNLLVDFIGRFENINIDFQKVCYVIGKGDLKLPHVKKSSHKHYQFYYDRELKDIIADHFSEDIKYFNYEF